MIDLVSLLVKAGNGGHGRVSLRREKFVPKGGPDGGTGGTGGNVIIRATAQYSTLQHLINVKEVTAQSGQAGGKRRQSGSNGADVVVEVPIGTTVWLLDENHSSQIRRRFNGGGLLSSVVDRAAASHHQPTYDQDGSPIDHNIPAQGVFSTQDRLQRRDEVEHAKFVLEKEGQHIPERDQDILMQLPSLNQLLSEYEDFRQVPKIELVSLTQDGQEVVLCQGGFGGRGNEAFKRADHQTPLEAEYGTWGEQKYVALELKLLADIGLVGLPNVGKSSLLARLTQAKPKIANYPFTTLSPNIGVSPELGLVIADIPGLIEGAHQGKGLGFHFLRHSEACKMLLVVLALTETEVVDETATLANKAQMLITQFKTVWEELSQYGPTMIEKPVVIVLNKIDLYPEELLQEIKSQLLSLKYPVVGVSAATHEGMTELEQLLRGSSSQNSD